MLKPGSLEAAMASAWGHLKVKMMAPLKAVFEEIHHNVDLKARTRMVTRVVGDGEGSEVGTKDGGGDGGREGCDREKQIKQHIQRIQPQISLLGTNMFVYLVGNEFQYYLHS
jgi:hypothetical protein